MSDFLKGGSEDADEWAYNWEIILFRKRVNVMMKIKMKMRLLILLVVGGMAQAEALMNFNTTPGTLNDVEKMSAEVAATAATVAAATSGSPQGQKTCTLDELISKKRDGTVNPDDENMGSVALRQCYYLSKGHLRNLFDKNGNPNSNLWTAALEGCSEPLDQSISDKKALCDGAAFLISTSELGWEMDPDSDSKTVKSSNGEMKCQHAGPETLDYQPCVDFIKNHDLMEMAQQTVQTGQNIYYQEKTMSAQADAAKSSETGTASLKVMHDSVKAQQNIMNQRATLDTGKLMVLVNKYKDIPEYEDLSDKCKIYETKTRSKGCENAIKPSTKFSFLMNQQGKEKMKGRLIQIGLQAGSNLAMGSLLSKRASDISGVIAKVESFKPIDPLAPSADNLQSTYCQQNPGASKCLTGGLERTFDAMGDNVITFGDGGTGVTFNNTNPYVDPNKNSGSGGSNTTTAGKSVTPVGSVISSAQNNGGLESTAPAAALGKGSAPAGGGGGGGSGGGSGGGGGGGGAPAGQGAGGVAAAIQGKTPTYGGGSGTLSMMGGFGINKAKSTAKDDGNPFGKLFNKETSKNGTLSFGRDPASQKVGDKGENIFDMISKRYSTVNTDKRLLEYEIAK